MIEPARATFLLIDMQNGFIDGASPLCIAGASHSTTMERTYREV